MPAAASRPRLSGAKPVEEAKEGDRVVVYVGDEQAYVSPNGWFTMGGVEQRPEDFKREVVRRIEEVMPFEEAWRLALEYVGSFDKRVLLSQSEFFEKAYLPVRDSFPEGFKRRDEGKQLTLF